MTTTNATVTKTTVGRGVAAAVLKTEPVAAAVATAGADKNQQRAAKTVAAAAAAAVATAMMPCHWTLLPGKCLRHIARAAAMVIDVACGPMAYKTQL